MNWVLAGAKNQALHILNASINSQFLPDAVLLMPGRCNTEINDFKRLCTDYNIRFMICNTASDVLPWVINTDFLFTCNFFLLPKGVFSKPRLGSINLHCSLLPYYRGVHPITWAIIKGETRTGLSLHHIDEKIDNGNIILQYPIAIDHQDNTLSLSNKLDGLSFDLAYNLFCMLKDKKSLPSGTRQPKGNYFYARKRSPNDGKLNLTSSSTIISNTIRALQEPLPLAYFTYKNNKILCAKGIILDEKSTQPPGTIINAQNNQYLIQASDKLISIEAIVC